MNMLEKENIDVNRVIPTSLAEEKQTLDNIEASVRALQTRIQYLLKEDSKRQKHLQSEFHCSLATVSHKLQSCQQQKKLRNLHITQNYMMTQSHSKVKQLKERQHEQFMAAKESLGEIRREEHESIRQLSRKNRQVIEDSRRELREKKKLVVSHIREEKEQYRMNVSRAAEERMQRLMQTKLEEHRRNQQRKKELADKIRDMEDKEKELLDRIKKTTTNTAQLATLRKLTSKMGTDRFEDIVMEVRAKEPGAVKEGRLTEKILQYILQYKSPLQRPEEEMTVRQMRQTPRIQGI